MNGNCPLADWLVGFCPNFGDKIAFLFEWGDKIGFWWGQKVKSLNRKMLTAWSKAKEVKKVKMELRNGEEGIILRKLNGKLRIWCWRGIDWFNQKHSVNFINEEYFYEIGLSKNGLLFGNFKLIYADKRLIIYISTYHSWTAKFEINIFINVLNWIRQLSLIRIEIIQYELKIKIKFDIKY